jgi:hypothetical protein
VDKKKKEDDKGSASKKGSGKGSKKGDDSARGKSYEIKL